MAENAWSCSLIALRGHVAQYSLLTQARSRITRRVARPVADGTCDDARRDGAYRVQRQRPRQRLPNCSFDLWRPMLLARGGSGILNRAARRSCCPMRGGEDYPLRRTGQPAWQRISRHYALQWMLAPGLTSFTPCDRDSRLVQPSIIEWIGYERKRMAIGGPSVNVHSSLSPDA